MEQMKGHKNDEDLGVGEVHLVTMVSGDQVPSDVLEERVGFQVMDPFELLEVLGSLELLNVKVKLKLHIHDFRTVVKPGLAPSDLENGLDGMYELEHRSAYLGAIELRGSQIFLGGAELEAGTLRRWIDACSTELWRGPELTPARAAQLAELITTYMREAERRSLETLRRTLGDEVTDQLLREGKIRVKSANGMEYVITDSGEVSYYSQTRDRLVNVCVQVEGGKNLPKYDRVLAKYLVLRDHPEQIDRPHRRPRAGGIRGNWLRARV